MDLHGLACLVLVLIRDGYLKLIFPDRIDIDLGCIDLPVSHIGIVSCFKNLIEMEGRKIRILKDIDAFWYFNFRFCCISYTDLNAFCLIFIGKGQSILSDLWIVFFFLGDDISLFISGLDDHVFEIIFDFCILNDILYIFFIDPVIIQIVSNIRRYTVSKFNL